jgi:hypothetical protein
LKQTDISMSKLPGSVVVVVVAAGVVVVEVTAETK